MLSLVAGVVLAATTYVSVAYAALPATVQGVTPRGTTINLFDYWLSDNAADRFNNDQSNPGNYQNTGINGGHTLKFGRTVGTTAVSATLNPYNVNHWTGNYPTQKNDAYKPAPRTGIVQSQLGDDGYPVLSNVLGNESLAYLFDSSSSAGKASFSNVGGLLQVDGDGYYCYNSTANFAQFDEDSNSFTLYSTWGVKAAGQSPDGQFFPFNTGNEVFGDNGTQNGVTSTNSKMHHYFGLNMSTNFIQQYGGHTEENGGKEVTYNFSGDDDVWVYIDGVLVGDLGGIHDKVALQINFATGEVVVYSDGNNNNEFDAETAKDGNQLGAEDIDDALKAGGDVYYQRTTLKALFRDAGADVNGWTTDTLPDNTYHTLKFFYLERGGTDSNMSLKYNLVTIPETDIQKVDQDGNGVAGAVFSVADQNGDPVCTATTENDGTVVLMDADRHPITVDQLATNGCTSLTFKETTVPSGYRSMGEFTMNIKQLTPSGGGDPLNVLLSASPWTTGAYAEPRVTVSLPTSLTNDPSYDTEKGMFFAVVEKKVNGDWYPVTGNGRDGWKVADNNSNASILEAGRTTNAVFVIASNGAYQADIDALPGDINDYEYFAGDAATLRVAYFYVNSKSFQTNAAPEQITNTTDFGRQFSAHLYLPNMVNRVAVQKLDENGDGLKGAEFGLYSADQVTVDEQGVATLNADAQPINTATTDDLTKEKAGITLSGGAVFTGLNNGTYYIGEISAPSGYAVNKTLTKVIVTDTGVYADAGVADDGVKVTRGAGRIVQSMQQFAEDDGIDATLADIIAQPKTLTENELNTVTGLTIDRNAGDLVHLKYAADKSNNTLDYVVQDGTTFTGYTVDEGIPYLVIAQDQDGVHKTTPRQEIDDNITNLFSGVTVVQVSDEPVGSLKVSKSVEGKTDNATEFEFTVTFERVTEGSGDEGESQEQRTSLTNDEAQAVGMQLAVADGEPAGVTLEDNGSITFKLKNGESAVVTNIPAGVTYTVAEKPSSKYETSYDPDSTGVIVKNEQAEVKVTNTYTPEITLSEDDNTQLKVTKKVKGASNETAFSFTAVLNEEKSHLADSDDAASTGIKDYGEEFKLTAATQGNFNAGDEQTASFGDVTFTKPGVYVFDVTEDQKTPDPAYGWKYDSDTKQITVTVTMGDDGDLRATTVADGKDTNNPTFTNEYDHGTVTLSGDTALKVQKTVTGAPTDVDFTFTATFDAEASAAVEDNPGTIAGIKDAVEGQDFVLDAKVDADFAEGDAAKSASFDSVTFTQPGTYIFNVVETNDDPSEGSGWSYDGTTKTITVTVSDTGKGALVADVSYNNDVEGAADADKTVDNAAAFTNTYKAGSVDVGGDNAKEKINVQKTLSGRNWQEGDSFEFVLTAQGGAPMPEGDGNKVTITDASSPKTASFGAITYDTENTYKYTVSETRGSLGGVTYDEHTVTVTVSVTDTDHDGKLEAAVSYDNSEATTDADKQVKDAAAFTNTYNAGETTVDTGSAEFKLTKVLEGKAWGENDSFTFKIEAFSNTAGIKLADQPMPVQTEVTVDKATGKDDSGRDQATFSFGTIKYDTAGTYVYKVTEVTGTNPGMDYSDNEATVTVSVTDDLKGGYTTAVSIENNTFTNEYASELDFAAAGGIKIVKTFENADMREFSFKVTPRDEASAKKLGIDKDGETLTTKPGATVGDDNASRAEIMVVDPEAEEKFTQEDADDTYAYTVQEVVGDNDDVEYDDTVYTVTITTADDGQGGIKVTTTVTNGAGYNKSYVYDNDEDTADPTAVIPFTNTYKATGELGGNGSVSINATKTLTNRPMADGEFSFNVTNANDANKAVVATGANDADGKITFSAIKYSIDQMLDDVDNGLATPTTVGDKGAFVYTYQVTEDTTNLGDGVAAVDAAGFSITVTVVDNGDGTLGISVAYPNGGDGITFRNTYGEASKATLRISGTKTLKVESGDNAPDITGKFEFTLTGSDGAPMPDTTTAKNDASGNVSFGDITYTMDNVFGDTGSQTEGENGASTLSTQRTKTFTYTVTESGNVAGVTNDVEASKTFTVTVTDKGDGTLSVVSDPASGALFSFTNTYSVETTTSSPTGSGAVTINKQLTGRNLNEGEFAFQMSGVGAPDQIDPSASVLTADNAADGSVSFGNVTFTKPGTYTYAISEIPGDLGGVTYDQSVYYATATVSDDHDGTLDVKWAFTDADGNEVKAITFANTYQITQPGSIVFGASKVLDGRELKGGEFSFELKDADGKVLQTVKNTADGSVVFDPITYDELGGGTYEYTISEVLPEDDDSATDGVQKDHVTYDETVYHATVTVTDNGDGTTTATVSYDGTDGKLPVFSNTYTAPAEPAAPQEGTPDQGGKLMQTGDSSLTIIGAVLGIGVVAIAAGVALKKRG